MDVVQTSPLAVSPERAAALLNLGRSKVFELLRTGKLRSFTVGRRRLIAVADLESFVRDERANAVPAKTAA